MSEASHPSDHSPPQDYPYFRRTWNNVVVALLAAAFIPLILIGGGMYFYMGSILEQKTMEGLRLDVFNHKKAIDQFLAERTMDLKLLSRNKTLSELSQPAVLEAVFQSLREQLPCFHDLGIIDGQGQHRAYVGPHDLLSRNYRETEWFQTVMQEGLYISDVFLGFRNLPHFIIAVKNATAEHPWIIRATVDTDYFHAVVREVAGKSRADAYLVNRRGIFQTTPLTTGRLMQPSPFKDFKPFTGVQRYESDKHLLLTTWLDKVPWICVVQLDRNEIFAASRRARNTGIYVFLLAAILIVMTVLLTTNHLVSRLESKRRSLRRLDQQLRRSNQLASSMELSYGFFREIKDTLANIDAAAAWMRDLARNGNPAKIDENLDQIRSEVARSRQSIDRFLSFTRPAEPMIREVDPHRLLDDILEFLEKELHFNNIRVIRDYASPLPQLRSDPSRLRQVFQNLILNAMAAVQKDGEITLTTRSEADGISVTISDNGPGIPEENRAKIFEPLFTTKPGGTGLGLPICAGILEKLGGRISLGTPSPRGASFVVELPWAFKSPG
ncbi:MAG: hypothetical protein JSW39_03885 [Desulfobacterales bacterium]|nr:MAG: hypothetical protein JSW39_03885 [Desulfobacterales bacterium]